MFLPKNIDFTHVEKYILSIRLTPDGFSFCIHCPTNPNIFYYKHTQLGGNNLSYIENVKKLIFDYNFFTYSFLRTNIIVVSDNYTLVPERFFDNAEAETLLSFNIHDISADKVLVNNILDKDIRLLFSIKKELYGFLTRNVWNPQFIHHIALMTPFLEKKSGAEKTNKCCVNFIGNELVDIYYFSHDQIMSAKTHHVANGTDAAYYIASTLEALNFKQSTDKLLLTGSINHFMETIYVMKRLIRNIVEIEYDANTKIPEEIEIPTDILAILCA